jgi:RimJ/RimL family protein N-acetyltransferase
MNILAKGQRSLLRDRISEDFETYQRWMATGEWRCFDAPWARGDVQEEMDAQTQSEYRERFLARLEEDLPVPRSHAIIETLQGVAIGWVNRYSRGSQLDEWCVGINLCEDEWLNRGYGSEALTLWVDYLFENSEIHRLALESWSFNPRMIRVAEKLGFRHEGRLREAQRWRGEWLDKLQFGLLRSEWQLR